MKKTIMLLPFLLAGCGQFGSSTANVADEVQWKRLADDHYELSVEGQPGVEVATLKEWFRDKGRALCADKVYLLRGMRESQYDNRHALRGQVDCVPLDYFEEAPNIAMKAPSKPAGH